MNTQNIDFINLTIQAIEPIVRDIGSILNQMVNKFGIIGTILILLIVKRIITK